jgi:hypothetical protein
MSNLQDSVNELFRSFSSNRQQTLEPRWLDSYNVFNRIIDASKHEKKGEAENWRSKAYLGTTRQKIVSAAAIIVDTMMQGGKINYMLQASEMSKEVLEAAGFPEDYNEDTKEKQEALIDDQLGWAKADLEMRRGILSGAIYGDSYAKVVLDDHTTTSFKPIEGTLLKEAPEALRFQFSKESRTYPKWQHISNWDVFTDLEDPDVRTNLGFFHRSFTRPAELKRMMKADDEGVIKRNLKLSLDASKESTPDTSATTSPKYNALNTTFNNLRLLDFYGFVDSGKLKTFLQDNAPDMLDDFDLEDEDGEVEVHLLLAGTNNLIVKVSTIDETLGRPVFHVPWEDDTEDSIGATGVADNCMNTQHLLNGIFRAIVDNQKLSGNALLGVKEEHLMESFNEIVPGKKIRLSPDCPDIRQALQNFQIQDVSGGLIQVFNIVSQMLEEDSNIPRIQQGIEASREETAFSASQRLEKSGKYFGQIVRNYDDGFVEAIISYMYRYNMIDPDVKIGKGDFDVQALGFSSFQNRITRLNGLRQFLELALSHPDIFEKLKLENLFREFARMLDLDPEQVTFSEEEVAEREAREAELARQAQEQAQLESAQKESIVNLNNSQAAMNAVNTNKANEELKMKQVETVADLTNNENQK